MATRNDHITDQSIEHTPATCDTPYFVRPSLREQFHHALDASNRAMNAYSALPLLSEERKTTFNAFLRNSEQATRLFDRLYGATGNTTEEGD